MRSAAFSAPIIAAAWMQPDTDPRLRVRRLAGLQVVDWQHPRPLRRPLRGYGGPAHETAPGLHATDEAGPVYIEIPHQPWADSRR